MSELCNISLTLMLSWTCFLYQYVYMFISSEKLDILIWVLMGIDWLWEPASSGHLKNSSVFGTFCVGLTNITINPGGCVVKTQANNSSGLKLYIQIAIS